MDRRVRCGVAGVWTRRAPKRRARDVVVAACRRSSSAAPLAASIIQRGARRSASSSPRRTRTLAQMRPQGERQRVQSIARAAQPPRPRGAWLGRLGACRCSRAIRSHTWPRVKLRRDRGEAAAWSSPPIRSRRFFLRRSPCRRALRRSAWRNGVRLDRAGWPIIGGAGAPANDGDRGDPQRNSPSRVQGMAAGIPSEGERRSSGAVVAARTQGSVSNRRATIEFGGYAREPLAPKGRLP